VTDKTLFVCIANYKDNQTIQTVRSLIDNASGEFIIKICVFSQIDLNDLSFDALDYIPEVLHIRYDYRKARGPCWARKRCQEFYNGEDYYLQIDSHIEFAKGWDVLLMEDYKKASRLNNKVIISAYPAAYELNMREDRIVKHYSSTRFIIKCNGTEIPNAVGRLVDDVEIPEEQLFLAAGFLFSSGSLVDDVPYDEEIFFLGEEITLATRAYSAGYKIYSPTKYICSHLYNTQKNNERPMFWDKEEESFRSVAWYKRDKTSKIKVKHICRGEWFGTYGIQNDDLYLEFCEKLKQLNPSIDLQKVDP